MVRRSAFVIDRQKNGGYLGFVRDLADVDKGFFNLQSKDMRRILRRVARSYVNTYNKILRSDSNSRITGARVSPGVEISGRNGKMAVVVNISEKAFFYDVAKPHKVSLKKIRVMKWVKAKWNFDRKWNPTKKRARDSAVGGTMGKPKGYLTVTSYQSRHHGTTIMSKALKRSLEVMNMELKFFIKYGNVKNVRKLIKPIYETRIYVTI